MKEIKSMSFNRLRNEELFGLLQRVLNLGQALLTQEVDATILAAYKAAVDSYDDALNQNIKFKDTEALESADKFVDELYRGLKHHARSLLLHPNSETRKNGKTVMNSIEKFGDVIRLPYNQQYGVLHNLMEELTAIPAETQTSLGLGPWLEGMTLAIAKFQSAREAQTVEKATYQVRLVKETRIAAERAHRTFIRAVNTFAVTFGEEGYASFIDQVNTMLADVKALLKGRTTRAENDKEDNAETPNDSVNTEDTENSISSGNNENVDNTSSTAA